MYNYTYLNLIVKERQRGLESFYITLIYDLAGHEKRWDYVEVKIYVNRNEQLCFYALGGANK